MEKCKICDKNFKNRGELSKHINKVHEGGELYYLNNLDNNVGGCKVCNKETLFVNIWVGYKNTCSKKCQHIYADMCRQQTFIKKYGVHSPSQIESVKNKISVSNKEKAAEALIKRKNTNKKKFGVENPFQQKEIKEKIKQINLEKYGNEQPQKTKEIKEKTKQTNLEKYGGNSPQSNPIIAKKSKNTKLQKYNNENYNNPLKAKETRFQKTGYNYSLQDPQIQKKFKETCKKKFGVCHPMQNKFIFEKALKTGLKVHQFLNTDITYQGSYELDFLENFYDKIDIKDGLSIPYIYNKKERIYHSDFYIPSKKLIVEIKSTYWNNMHKKLNAIKSASVLDLGYNFILIENKNYDEFMQRLIVKE